MRQREIHHRPRWSRPIGVSVARVLGAALLGHLLCHSRPAAADDTSRYSEMSLAELLSVPVVVATKQEQDSRDAPAVTSVLTDKHISLFGLRTLEDALKYLPGIQISHIPNGEVVPVVRGIGTENGVAVLIDGVPVLDTVTGQFYHYDLSLNGVKRIELLRGPAAALFGGNANAGVINLVTKDADDEGSTVGATVGVPSLIASRSSFVTGLGRWGSARLSLAAEHDEGNLYTIQSDGAVLGPDRQRSLLNPSNPDYIGKRGEPATRVTGFLRWSAPGGVRVSSSVMYRSLSPLLNPSYGGGRGAIEVTAPGDYVRQDLLLANELRWESAPTEGLKLSLSARHVLNQRDQKGYITAPNTDGDHKFVRGLFEDSAYGQQRASLDAELDVKLPGHNALTVGATAGADLVDRQRYRTNYEFYSGPVYSEFVPRSVHEASMISLLPSPRRWWAATYLQDVFSPWPWLDLVAGARLDWFMDQGIVSKEQLAQDALCQESIYACGSQQRYSEIRGGRTYYQLSPRVALIGKINRGDWKIRFKLMAGQAFTPPPILSLTSQTPVNFGDARFGNPFLSPTVGRTVEFSYSVSRSTHEVRLGGFWIRTSDEVAFDPETHEFGNSASRSVYGPEVEATGSQTLWRDTYSLYYRLGASYQTTWVTGGRLLGIGADMYPRLLSSLLFGLQWNQKVSLGLGMSYASSPRREPLDPRKQEDSQRVLADLIFSVKNVLTEGLDVSVAAKNITGEVYADPLSHYLYVDGDYPRGGRLVFLDVSLSR